MGLFLLVVAVMVVAVPATLYVAGRSNGRNAWGLCLQGFKKNGAGAYRAQLAPVWIEGKPPLVIHIASITSFILGQMVVPGALAALVGLLVCLEFLTRGVHDGGDVVLIILMLSVPTGLMIGGKLLDVGLALLQRAENAVTRARELARFSFGHNILLLLLMGLVYASSGSDAVWFPAVYALISMGQAGLLLSAARAIETHAEAEARDRELAPLPTQLASSRT